MAQQKIIISVTNDLTTDQRVAKICNTLKELNFEIILVGRQLKDSLPINRPYQVKRFKLLFNKGPLFYACYNVRLFLFLLFNKADVYWSNDLDTLLANFIASKWKNKQLIFDSHEYYTEVPELVNRPKVQAFWKRIERKIIPQLKHITTVSKSIAELYKKEYGVDVKLLRNVPEKDPITYEVNQLKQNGIKVIIYQGAININRGIEYMVRAMKYVDNGILYLIGKGDIYETIQQLIAKENLNNKVKMLGEVPYEKLHSYTIQADLGLSLEEDKGLNYRLALPNKLFNYIHANVPVLVSNLPEMSALVKQYNIGCTIEKHDAKHIADKIMSTLNDAEKVNLWKNNTKKAAQLLNWEIEKEVISSLF